MSNHICNLTMRKDAVALDASGPGTLTNAVIKGKSTLSPKG